jgi:hypothetical protein
MFCLKFSKFFESNHQVFKKSRINNLIENTLNRWPVKILQGEEEEEDLGVGDIIEENWRCSVENPHHNLPQHYQSNQAPLSWQQTDLGGQWHLELKQML